MHDFAGNPVNNALMQAFDDQRSRGTQGFGIYDGEYDNLVHSPKEDGILNWLVKYPSSLMLMHHRFPTSTVNVKRAAHPFTTKKYFGDTEYILVHNGGIRNADELFCDHQELGIEYHSWLQDLTFNDSEALLWDFALTMEGKQPELKARGGIAFIALQLKKGKLKKMYFGRNTNPLRIIRNRGGVALASELEDGEMIDAQKLYTWHYQAKRLTVKDFDIPNYATVYRYTGQHQSQGYTWSDCNCNDVGWSNCRYHGTLYGDSEDYSDSNYEGNYDNYDRRSRDEHKLAEKVGNVLSRQFGDRFKRKQPDYIYDKQTKLIVPNPVLNRDSAVIARKQSEDRLLADNPITAEEITQEYMAYLAHAKGKFETAYWRMEWEYEEALEQPDTKENIRARRLLEYVMERIDNDPEYKDENSVSNVWEVIWQK